MSNVFYVLIGAPGSGKSTIAEGLGCKSFSLDLGRETLCGTRQCWDKEEEVRQWVRDNLESELRKGNDVAYDATNINSKSRSHWLNWFRSLNISCKVVAVVLTTPEDEVIRRNHTRPVEHRVPDDVVKGFFERFEEPSLEEGFDQIVHM